MVSVVHVSANSSLSDNFIATSQKSSFVGALFVGYAFNV